MKIFQYITLYCTVTISFVLIISEFSATEGPFSVSVINIRIFFTSFSESYKLFSLVEGQRETLHCS
jgi:hypothetical protein